MAAQTAHVNQNVPAQSVQLPPQLLVLALEAAKVEKLFAGICDVGPQVVGANIGPQPRALNAKAGAVVELKNAARGGCAGRFLEAGAADVTDHKACVRTGKGLRIVDESWDLKAADALERPEQA